MSAVVTRQLPLVASAGLFDLIGTGDPSVSPGLDYAVGSRFSATDGALGTVLWVKYGSGATDWSPTLGGSGGGGGSGVTDISTTSPIVASGATGSVALSHDVSGVTAAYGDATHVPVVTFDAEGHATAASTVALSIPSSDPSTDTKVWMPLTTVVGGVPQLVWDANNSLIPTLVPI